MTPRRQPSTPNANARLEPEAGAFLGIDVGSSRSKVLAFCLVTVDAQGAVRVAFERGGARVDVEDPTNVWPANDAASFVDLASPRWAAAAVERGVRRILERSATVARWVDASNDPRLVVSAALDAPCGFASAGATRRESERGASASFDTADAARFEGDLRRFARDSNETPLRQRFFWKLVGFAAYRSLMSLTGHGSHDAPLAAVTAFCAQGLGSAAQGGALPPRPAGQLVLREVFPSDTYARANGTRGALRHDARALLRALADAPWEFDGERTAHTPTALMQQRLREQRRTLRRQLAERRDGPLSSMRKIPGDPSWADLWDAFACAFVGVCEANGAAIHLGTDPDKLVTEGPIIAPAALTVR